MSKLLKRVTVLCMMLCLVLFCVACSSSKKDDAKDTTDAGSVVEDTQDQDDAEPTEEAQPSEEPQEEEQQAQTITISFTVPADLAAAQATADGVDGYDALYICGAQDCVGAWDYSKRVELTKQDNGDFVGEIADVTADSDVEFKVYTTSDNWGEAPSITPNNVVYHFTADNAAWVATGE